MTCQRSVRRCLAAAAFATVTASAALSGSAEPLPTPPTAEDVTKAAALIDEGKRLFGLTRYAEALDRFDQALVLTHSSRALAFRGFALARLGRHIEAAGAFQQYLDGTDKDLKTAEKVASELAAVDAALGHLVLKAGLAPAAGPPPTTPPEQPSIDPTETIDPFGSVEIDLGDGHWIPLPARAVRVMPGPFAVRARGQGTTAEASGTVEAGKWLEVLLELTPPTPEQLLEALLAEGARLAAAGDHAAVVDKFSAAYDLVQDVRLLPGLAAANVALGRDLEAAGECETYLAAPAREPSRETEVRALLAGIDARLGHLEIVAPDAAGVEVKLGGAAWAPLPRGPVRVAPGAFHVAGRVGERSQAVQGTVAPGATTRVELQLAVREAVVTGELTKQTARPSRGGRPPSRWSALAGAVGTISDPGVRGVLGVGYRPHPRIRLGLDAILGAGPGLAPNATVYLTDARLQPFVQLAMPLRWLPSADGGCGEDCVGAVYGTCAGESVYGLGAAGRGALGLAWRVSPRTALHVSVGYERYPFADGCLFTPTVFTPSLGVEARL